MEEIIEGCFKLFFGILFCLGIPVVIAYYAFWALCYVLDVVSRWWQQYGIYVLGTVGALIVTMVLVTGFAHWWELHQIKRQRKRSIRKLDLLFRQTTKRMDELGQAASGGAP